MSTDVARAAAEYLLTIERWFLTIRKPLSAADARKHRLALLREAREPSKTSSERRVS